MSFLDLTGEVVKKIVTYRSMKDLIVKPDYTSLNLSSLRATLLKMLGLEPRGSSLYEMEPFKGPLEDLFKHQSRRLLLLLVDSLNLNLLSDLLAHLESLGGGYGKILKGFVTSTFPSVTPTALMTLYTGLPPLAHGIVGFEFYYGAMDRIVNPFKLDSDMVFLKDIFGSFDSLFEEAARSRIGVCAYVPKELVSNPATHQMLNKARIFGYRSLLDVSGLIAGVRNAKLIYVYFSKLDETLHREGSASHKIGRILREILTLVRHSLKNGFIMVLLSDHSFIDVDKKVNVKTGRGIASNGGRVIYLYNEERGHLRFRNGEKESFECFSRDRLIGEGWFGEGECFERVGETVLIAKGRVVLTHKGKESKDKAAHGGFLFEEMIAPLAIISPP